MTTGPLPSRADVLVVGGGTAGCLIARRLAERGRDVVLLEQGPGHAPGAEVTALNRLPLNDALRSQRYRELRGRPVVRGRGLGGSATINGGYFLRGEPGDYLDWPGWWTPERIGAGFAAVESLLGVTAFDDDELGTAARAFEASWPKRSEVIRVRSNRRDGHRTTAAGLLAQPQSGSSPVQVIGVAPVDEVLFSAGRVTGVRVGSERIAAGEVIVSAGTLGSAALLRASGVLREIGAERLDVHEHPERLIRWRPRRELSAPALLQSVAHTPDGLEIRCYSDDFECFSGVTVLGKWGVPIGVADLGHPPAGSLDESGLDLGAPDSESVARMDRGAAAVVSMLESSSFAELLEPGSVTVDPVISMSQHAFGTLPLGGSAVDEWGRVRAIDGLRVVDGSILPGALRAGPHATIAMAAWVIAGAL